MLWPVPTPRRPGDPHPRGREFFGPATPVRGRWPAAGFTLLLALATRTAAAAPATPDAATTSPTTTIPASPTSTSSASPAAGSTGTNGATTSAAAPATGGATTSTAATGETNTSTAAPATSEPTPAAASDTGPVAAPPTAATPPPAAATARVPARKPPRVDGPYIGGTIAAGGTFARVNNFATPDPLSGGTMSLRFGQAIYPWMTIGLQVTGTWANRFADPRQRLLQGAAIVDFGFLPVPRIPLSLHVGFGAGGGAVRQADRTARSGFGGAVFTGAVRYEIFPLAARKRPTRGGGFSLGPELGWIGFTPAAKGRPMSNTLYIGLFMGFYFGS